MKTKFFHNCVAALALCGAIGLTTFGNAAAQSTEADISFGIPQLMMVERVDAASGTVVLNGNTYRYSTQRDSLVSAPRMDQRSLSIRDLKPGMEVLVATDGIEPSADYQPRIRGLWQPQ